MIDDIAMFVGRLLVWWVIIMGGLVLLAAALGAARDIFLKLKRH